MSDFCPKPCNEESYNPRLQTFSESPKIYVNLYPYYSTTNVKKTKEFFVYDAMTILSSLGGTLGLLLGYSILSMMLTLLDKLESQMS